MATEVIDRPLTRAERLKQATQNLHERLDTSIVGQDPFADRDRYVGLVEIQYRFMAAIEPLYCDPGFVELLPGLPQRSRLESAKRDLGDLGRPAPEVEPLPIAGKAGLGWLYVSEGSTLGAAFLLKAVEEIGLSQTFGGRHLAPAPEGRGRHWRDFKDMLNAVQLDACEEEQVVAGALAAFAHIQALVDAGKVRPD